MKYLNVHASLYIQVISISMDHEHKKTHLLDDHKDLFAFFWSCPIYTTFHWTSLLLEAFNFLGYKIKSKKTVTSLGFSYLMISKSAETLRRVNTPESLQTMETMEVSLLVHLQGSDCSHTSFSEHTWGARAGGQCLLITALEGWHLSAILSLFIPQDKTLGHTSWNQTSKSISPLLFWLCLKYASWTLYSLRAWTYQGVLAYLQHNWLWRNYNFT